MSATRDPSQKIGFIYSNLYQLYKKGKEAAVEADVPSSSASSRIIPGFSPGTVVRPTPGLTRGQVIKAYQPQTFQPQQSRMIPERKPTPAFLHQKRQNQADEGVQSLKRNLQSLQEVHGKLKFILDELNEMLGPKKS